jgi:beta-glucosidase/6-phospho-beta-glucosidase/beta-galactosidase
MYPEGLYRALHQLGSLKVPIYVTENGCADATGMELYNNKQSGGSSSNTAEAIRDD